MGSSQDAGEVELIAASADRKVDEVLGFGSLRCADYTLGISHLRVTDVLYMWIF